jgi:hypothetical protein
MSKLQKKPSALKRGHPTLQNINFYNFFSTFVGYFCPPGSGSGFTDPIESGSKPDPQPCFGTVVIDVLLSFLSFCPSCIKSVSFSAYSSSIINDGLPIKGCVANMSMTIILVTHHYNVAANHVGPLQWYC